MSKKLMLIGVAVGICALVVGMAGFFALWNKVSAMEQMMVKLEKNGKKDGAPGASDGIGPLYSLDTMIVNLGDSGGKRYLRVTMDLELANEKLVAEVEKRLPQIKDTVLTILPNKNVEDITPAGGKLALRDELIKALNGSLGEGAVSNIYFTEFVIQ